MDSEALCALCRVAAEHHRASAAGEMAQQPGSGGDARFQGICLVAGKVEMLPVAEAVRPGAVQSSRDGSLAGASTQDVDQFSNKVSPGIFCPWNQGVVSPQG